MKIEKLASVRDSSFFMMETNTFELPNGFCSFDLEVFQW